MTLDYTVPFGAGIAAAVIGAALLAAFVLARAGAFVLRRRGRPLRRMRLAGAALLVAGAASIWVSTRAKGATLEHAGVDLLMTQAPRPPRSWREIVVPPAPYVLLAGDLHCHITPPDARGHVVRQLPETIQLAQKEQLDFVSLLAHAWSGFLPEARGRRGLVAGLAELQKAVDARPDDGLILDVGIEYVDPTGHVGMIFGDVPAALAATPPEVAAARPGAFFDAFKAGGGVLVIHHPLLTPIKSHLPLSSLDISWQPFTGKPPFRPEIAAVDARADGVEVANLFVSAVRDRYLLGDPEDSIRRGLALLDQQIIRQRRRMTPVGGTDSHSFHLRPMTFVLAETRTRASIRDAIRAGRTCVMQPGACTFEARPEGSAAFSPVGTSLRGVRRIEARASGRAIAFYKNGERMAAPRSGEIVSFDVDPDACSVLRATVDGGYSAPVYVNCPFASEDARTARRADQPPIQRRSASMGR
jgi:hypothetical protein